MSSWASCHNIIQLGPFLYSDLSSFAQEVKGARLGGVQWRAMECNSEAVGRAAELRARTVVAIWRREFQDLLADIAMKAAPSVVCRPSHGSIRAASAAATPKGRYPNCRGERPRTSIRRVPGTVPVVFCCCLAGVESTHIRMRALKAIQ